MDAGDDVGDLRDKHANLGTLRVDVWRCVTTGPSPKNFPTIPESKVVSEKEIKGKSIDVSTSYVRTPLPKIGSSISVRYLDKTAIASFSFKYRTRRALQSLLIIEPDPVPVPLEERPIEELTREELLTLLQRQKVRRSPMERGSSSLTL
ncbi:hypothetical protein, variant [Exophiala mesophila]|uniref:DUF7918 domain-containing protein n=1 Tax=Exophiala mesophila TaxID=212818 RepID=A0A0D1Z1Z6_EXOME|nr:hypothetical protein, variant [Exophiala mesophila]KIV88792.1 hypothetical protein, variant [Exophiala mesophila]